VDIERLRKVKPSRNVIDNTDLNPLQRLLDNFLTLLNPISGYNNIRGSLIENGFIDPPKRRFDWGPSSTTSRYRR
jgi:hypothetical protein